MNQWPRPRAQHEGLGGQHIAQEEGAGAKSSLYPGDKYSLYSTDTEDRIISVDKGLERCAAMLKALEEDEEEMKASCKVPQGKGKKPEKPLPTWRKVPPKAPPNKKAAAKSSEARKPRSVGVSNAAMLTKQLEQGQGSHHHHTHPTACSTPDSKQGGGEGQLRSKSNKPGPRNMKEKRSTVSPPPVGVAERELAHCEFTGSTEELHLKPPAPARKNVKPHRRLRTEPGGKVSSLTNLRSGRLRPACNNVRANSASERNKKSTTTTTPTHLPPPPPPLFHPYYPPYAYPCFPPYLPPPYYPHYLPVDWTQELTDYSYPPSAYKQPRSQTEALDLATLHHRYPFHYPRADYYTQDGYYGTDYWKQQQKRLREQARPHVTADRANPATGGDVGRAHSGDKGRDGVDFVPPPLSSGQNQNQVLDVESLDVLLCELLNSCEEQVQGIRVECGSLIVGRKLDEVRTALTQCRQQLHQQCRRLAVVQKQSKNAEPSAIDWLPQIQQLEQEKAGLIERLKESCTAYSEVRNTLGDFEKAKMDQDRELEEKKLQISELQNKLDSVTKEFGKTVADFKSTKEELANAKKFKQMSADMEKKMKEKNAVLQQQVHSLSENLTTLSREKIQLTEELTQAKQAGGEDQQMLKVALSEKNTQLLHVQDQLLGLRQCLARFVAEASKSRSSDPKCSVGASDAYFVSANAINSLRDLANNGNIERFLSACSEERAAKSYSSSSSLREGSPGSVSSVTVTGDEEQGTLLPAARTESLPQINVITPLYSHTSSSVTSETSGRREAQETGLTGLGSVEREESEPQQRAAGMQYDYQLYPLNPTSSRTSVTTDVRSNTTTTSEVDFRNNLASLDADIARLQMQFKVALQPSNDSTQ